MKKLKNILFFIFTAAYITVISGFISRNHPDLLIESTVISVRDSAEYKFISKNDIGRILTRDGFNAAGKHGSEISLGEIENLVLENRIVKKVQAYITEPGVLHIDIWQKNPFLRISSQSGQGYYIDREGNIIPLSGNFSPYVIIASGFIREPFPVSTTGNIFIEHNDSLTVSQKTIYDLYNLATFIDDDKFWNEQIEQIYVNSKHEFELVPRVGPHIIELGSTENMEEKFENLRLLYDEGLASVGWNKYEKISLKYKNQVVCTKNQ
jgi:cell division protein FtsQ